MLRLEWFSIFRMTLWSQLQNCSFWCFLRIFLIETPSNYIFLLFNVRLFSEKTWCHFEMSLQGFFRDLQSTEDRIVTLLWYRCYTVHYGNQIFVGKCAVSNNTFPLQAVSINRHFLCLQVSQNGLEIIGLMIDRLASDFRQDMFYIFFLTFFYKHFLYLPRHRLLYVVIL